MPTHDLEVKNAANYAVKSIAQRSNSLSPYELLEIVLAKAKVRSSISEILFITCFLHFERSISICSAFSPFRTSISSLGFVSFVSTLLLSLSQATCSG